MKKIAFCFAVVCFAFMGCSDVSEEEGTSGGDGTSEGVGTSEGIDTPKNDSNGCVPATCDGTKVCLKTDSNHCGSCGHACSDNQVCNDQKCEDIEDGNDQKPACSDTVCDGACVDIQTNSKHCGDCGHACGEGQSCIEGVCKDQSGPECSGKVCDGACVDIKSDSKHCGDCGHACGEGQSCNDGVCKDASSTCDDDHKCDGVCVDFNTDNKHCGGCGYACGTGLHCENMNCACDDKALTKCGYNLCVNLKTDSNHCGECNKACSNGGTCTNGACSGGVTPPPEQTEGAGPVTGPGAHVIEYARQFLYSNTHMCTYDLKVQGKMNTLIDLSDFHDAELNKKYNYGYEGNCANFVSAVLIDTNEVTAQDFLNAANPDYKYREMVESFIDLCQRGAKGYHFLSDVTKAQAGDIWIAHGYDKDGNKRNHVELIIKVEGEYFWQIGSNNYGNENDKIGCLQNPGTDSKYSTNAKKYQRVTEHKRHISDGDNVRFVCSKR